MRLGVIADDFTGATDIAGFLAENGLSAVQLIGVPGADVSVDAEAVVISLKSRSCPAEEAVSVSLAAARWLRDKGCNQLFFKYCSTFDSTAKGNIGPVTDALLHELKADFTVVCPALPVNGRTVYHGYLFVGDVLLNESGMRNHPITPMRDANLMRLMEAQSQGKAANISAQVLDSGDDAVREALRRMKADGIRYAVFDALNDRHLDAIGRIVQEMPLVTGGSGLGAGIARAVAPADHDGKRHASDAGSPPGGKAIVLSGSCSVMTNAQVAAYKAEVPSLPLDIEACLSGPETYAGEVCKWAEGQSEGGLAPLVYATTDAGRLQAIQESYGAQVASTAIETFFGLLSPMLMKAGFDHFIVAGGETSGVIVQSLGITGFHIGPQIAPGVPWVRAIDAPLSLALKSGNFGNERFFFEAQQLCRKG